MDYVKAAFQPFLFIAPFFETFATLIATRVNSGLTGKRKEIVRGSIMAVIAVAIFGGLFASADAQFSKLFADIFNFHIDDKVIARIIFGTFMTAFFMGVFGYLFRKTHASSAPPVFVPRNLGAVEMTILLSAIITIFFIFIIVQISALFGGVEHLFANGLTYAEYAREGFIQLIAVAVLSFLMILFAECQIIKRDGGHPHSFRILSGVLVLQVIVILASAFHRLTMYEDAYGFTTARFFSHMLMVWLTVGLGLLSLHIWLNGKRQVFLFQLFSSIIVFFLLMNIMDPDAFIAKKNLVRYVVTGRIDANYLGTLSDDALPKPLFAVTKNSIEFYKNKTLYADIPQKRRSRWYRWG